METHRPLEPSTDQMRLLVERSLDRIVAHVESLPEQPAFDLDGATELARAMAEELPEQGCELDALLDRIFAAVPKSFNAAGPGYLAYIPGGGLFESAVADLISSAVNRYVGVFAAAPALVRMELNVVGWLCRIVGYPAGAGGTLTSGGSLGNFTAVFTARKLSGEPDLRRLVLYASDQAHHSVVRAADLAGIPLANIRSVPCDAAFRMRTDALREAIASDRRNGLRPMMIVASAGTTNSGAVDDLEAIADLARDEHLWLHVDAAYGGFFMLTERGRRAMRGIERADSIVLDPHKGLFVPYGTGAVIVRDVSKLRQAHSIHADYLPPMQSDADLVDPCEVSPELSRPFRGLRVWLPVRLHGIGAFREALDEKLDLTGLATEELRRMPEIEIVAEPQLSLVAFRLKRARMSGEALDELNRRFLDAINAKKRVMLTGTMLRGTFALRICVLSFRTHRDRIEAALEDIRAAIAEVRG